MRPQSFWPSGRARRYSPSRPGVFPNICSYLLGRVSSPISGRWPMQLLRQRRARANWSHWGAEIGFILWILTVPAFADHSNKEAVTSPDPQGGQSLDQKLFGEMRWRCIGPFRGGRTVAISGVPHQPNVFYMAAVNGGVWKTTDFGNTWNPIFDDQPTGSVGALAVAPSDPDVIYVGSGEGLQRPDLATGD